MFHRLRFIHFKEQMAKSNPFSGVSVAIPMSIPIANLLCNHRIPRMNSRMSLLVITTGGTIDKVYFDESSEYEVGEPTVPHVFRESGVVLPWRLEALMRKDSLAMNEEDRKSIRRACEDASEDRILLTHGTDTMCETAEFLLGVPGKTIVLTGALAPARFRVTDAIFNLGLALGAVQSMPPGVYLAMNGVVFSAGSVRKNRKLGQFEALEDV
jgi:L-asparaginase